MITMILAFAVSFVISVITAKILIPLLRRAKAGQSIREDGPVWHMSKQGTPTMGGIIFIAGIIIACITVGFSFIMDGDLRHIFVLVFALIYGAIGFLDDYEKLKKKQNLGLTAIQKFMLQLVAAVAFVFLLRYNGYLNPNLYIPFINKTIPVWEPLYFIFAAFVIIGTVNAVNLTDGVDGLATGVSIPVAVCYAAVAAYWGYTTVGLFAAALAGGLVAFLLFNFHPAKVFMGDTGSLFLGGAVAALAFVMDMPLVLVPLGIVYIIEALSDIIQVLYFKLTHGKRVFKMAPLHHHFEMSGWNEYKVFGVFSAVSLIFAVIAFLGVFERYSL